MAKLLKLSNLSEFNRKSGNQKLMKFVHFLALGTFLISKSKQQILEELATVNCKIGRIRFTSASFSQESVRGQLNFQMAAARGERENTSMQRMKNGFAAIYQ